MGTVWECIVFVLSRSTGEPVGRSATGLVVRSTSCVGFDLFFKFICLSVLPVEHLSTMK